MTKACHCNEGFLRREVRGADGKVSVSEIRAPLVHDCKYVKARDALIPKAERIAQEKTKPGGPSFSANFMEAMNELWRNRRAA